MDDLLARLIDANIPKLNPHVMTGLACLHMKNALEYIDRIFRSASVSFPKGLEYLGYERCTPNEEYEEVTKLKNNKRVYDLAKSDLYLVKFKFAFEGKPIPPRYIYLPFVSEGGIFSLGGPLYHITPVLSDKVISPGFDSVFVRLMRDKITFKRCYHTFIVDNVRETTHVVWSQIYRKTTTNKVANTTKALTSMAHYLFAKYGVEQTFLTYCGFSPIIGENEINVETYPSKDWIICESCQVAPKTYIGAYYTPTTIKIAIPKTQWSVLVKAFVAGFYYIVDHFPHRFKASYVNNTNLWMILLGHILFSGHYGENKLLSQVQEHFVSLDDYADEIVIEKLKESNYHIKTFYDLLALILNQFNNLVLENEHAVLSMYGKSLEVLYYVFYDITSGIFKVNFKLSKLATKKPLTEKDIIETFNKNMKQGAIFALSSGKIITESVSYSGDNMYPKITSKITEQESLPGATRSRGKRLVVGENQHIDISMVEAGSILFISKANPTPVNKLNPFVNIDAATGTILPNPKFDELRQATQEMFRGKTSHSNPSE